MFTVMQNAKVGMLFASNFLKPFVKWHVIMFWTNIIYCRFVDVKGETDNHCLAFEYFDPKVGHCLPCKELCYSWPNAPNKMECEKLCKGITFAGYIAAVNKSTSTVAPTDDPLQKTTPSFENSSTGNDTAVIVSIVTVVGTLLIVVMIICCYPPARKRCRSFCQRFTPSVRSPVQTLHDGVTQTGGSLNGHAGRTPRETQSCTNLEEIDHLLDNTTSSNNHREETLNSTTHDNQHLAEDVGPVMKTDEYIRINVAEIASDPATRPRSSPPGSGDEMEYQHNNGPETSKGTKAEIIPNSDKLGEGSDDFQKGKQPTELSLSLDLSDHMVSDTEDSQTGAKHDQSSEYENPLEYQETDEEERPTSRFVEAQSEQERQHDQRMLATSKAPPPGWSIPAEEDEPPGEGFKGN